MSTRAELRWPQIPFVSKIHSSLLPTFRQPTVTGWLFLHSTLDIDNTTTCDCSAASVHAKPFEINYTLVCFSLLHVSMCKSTVQVHLSHQPLCDFLGKSSLDSPCCIIIFSTCSTRLLVSQNLCKQVILLLLKNIRITRS